MIDPAALVGSDVYFGRIETVIEAMLQDDGVSLLGDRRHASVARAVKDGVEVETDLEKRLPGLARR